MLQRDVNVPFWKPKLQVRVVVDVWGDMDYRDGPVEASLEKMTRPDKDMLLLLIGESPAGMLVSAHG